MNDNDEIMIKYQMLKIKQRKKILVFIVIILLCMATGGGFFLLTKGDDTSPISKPVVKEEISEPILELKKEKIEVDLNNEIDYLSYVKKAFDKKDGNLLKKVTFNKVDVSKAGTYTVTYKLKNSAKKSAKAKMIVVIREKIETVDESVDSPVTDSSNFNKNENRYLPPNNSGSSDKGNSNTSNGGGSNNSNNNSGNTNGGGNSNNNNNGNDNSSGGSNEGNNGGNAGTSYYPDKYSCIIGLQGSTGMCTEVIENGVSKGWQIVK